MEQIYLGITPYDEDGGFEFAGRNDETWALYDRIIRNDYTVYYAASGEGKSSLIRAGLLPILRRRDYFPVYIVFEDKELWNISSIKGVIDNRIEIENIKHNVSYEQSAWSKSRFSIEQSEILKNNLWWKLRNYCFKRGDVELKPLFIFDQFEEVFTKANYEWTDHFFKWLEEISTDYVPESLCDRINSWGIEMPTQKNFKALFSFRTEYLGDLDYWCVQKHFLPSLQENRMCLKPLTPKGAREVIRLNESLLGIYGDKIIHGCAETNNVGDDNQPCVYALILSVVCQTLSEIPDKERITLLDNLNNNQDNTIDDVLLRFYKKKLKAVGLDYIKDEKIIADIEDAFVDEKGKRSRRDTDEASMQSLLRWIDLLSDKKNGLIKIIGKKEIDGIVINTVEFPHDRLCKAIDSSRKERQGKIAWKLNRQGEWMQFGVITTIVVAIAFLWNALMPAIKPIVNGVLSSYEEKILVNGVENTIRISGIEKIAGLLCNNYLLGKHSELANYSLDEGFSSIILMGLLIFFIPLITVFVSRRTKKWQIVSSVMSFFSALLFMALWWRSRDIEFVSGLFLITTLIGFFTSSICLFFSFVKLKTLLSSNNGGNQRYFPSFWPLWGGYFMFASYVFYECLFRTTFGINEPCDSSWAIIALPLLFVIWAYGFYNIDAQEKKRLLFTYFVASSLILLALFIISYIPFYNKIKQSSGLLFSMILLVLWISITFYIIWKSKSNSKYYILSNTKRFFASILSLIVILLTFYLNLGYNPFKIKSSSICHVSSWRNVLVYECDSFGNKRLGIVYSTNCDTIVSCCIPTSQETDSMLIKGEYPFYGGKIPIESPFKVSPFGNDTLFVNTDNTLLWDANNKRITAYIPIVPTLEEYLHKKKSIVLSNKKNLADSIEYYSAILFSELRNANINYALTGVPYGLDALTSLPILDSLQHKALSMELEKFSICSMDTTIMSGGRKNIRKRIEVLEDKHLVDFHCELSRSFLLCLIKDRANQLDMPSLYTLSSTYLLSFFTSVPAMNINSNYNTEQTVTQETKIGTKVISEVKKRRITYRIYSDDILNRRLFSWYDLFNSLCLMDIGWNVKTFERVYANPDKFNENAKVLTDISKELSEVADNTDYNSSNASNNSIANLIKRLEMLLKRRDQKFYESILERLESIDLTTNTLAVDESLRQLKENVLGKLLPVIEDRQTGIYNNDFENICKNFILVSAFRGNDIGKDTTDFSNYLIEKNKFYYTIKSVSNANQVAEQKKEVERALKEIIKKVTNK